MDARVRRKSLLIFLILAACSQTPTPEAPRPVKAIQIAEPSSSTQQIVFPGTVRAYQRADLSFRVDGTVIIRDISVGQQVKQGEPLMQLDPHDYEVAVKKAEGNLASVRAQLDFANRDYERMKNIHDKDPGAISLNYLDRTMENANRLAAQLSVAQSELDQANDNLSYTHLTAPFDGIIAAIYVENHEQVRAKEIVLRFLDTEEREMEINVPERFINLIFQEGKGLPFKIVIDAFPGQLFSAKVKEISTEASSTTQTYLVTLSMVNIPSDLSLLPGMTGKAILPQPNTHPIPLYHIPKEAIFTDNLKQSFVWVVDPKTQTVHKKQVLVENYVGGKAEIKEGLQPGEWVVVAGTSFLTEGQKVKIAAEPESH